ncbi:hypothetical protein JXI42_07645 [bacterium]|nr:hypothetical protein [bacterium]
MKSKIHIFVIFMVIVFTVFYAHSYVIVARDVYGVASGLNNQRAIVRDSEGNLYIAYPGNDGEHWQIYIAYSTDGGATWEPEWAAITDNELEDIQISMAIDSRDTLHLVWKGNYATNDGDLMYRKYPGGENTAICAHSGYPGANCPSIAVGPDDDLHIAYTGCPSSWLVRYLHYNRSTATWDPPEDVGTHTPSRWPSIEVDSDNNVHIVYRNQPAANYRVAHREKEGDTWLPVEQIDVVLNSMEYTSLFIDKWDNVHATWVLRNTFYGNPDTVRYRRFNPDTDEWEHIVTIFGTDTSLTYCGDVVVDTAGIISVFYHDFINCYVRVSYDGGYTFEAESCLTELVGSRYPNARGSNFPEFNRINDECIDFVYTWRHPDSLVSYLVYDNVCGITEETTFVTGRFILPGQNSYTSCREQSIMMALSTGESGDYMLEVPSLSTTTEYWDSLSGTWKPAVEITYSGWGERVFPGSSWIWDSVYTGSSIYLRCLTFRSIIETPPGARLDSARVSMYADNTASFYMNGNFIGADDDADIWYHIYTFDMLPYMHGGADTLTVEACDLSRVAVGLNFIAEVFYSTDCGIDTSSILFVVDEGAYTVGDGFLAFTMDSLLIWTPPSSDFLSDNDTIRACLISAESYCDEVLDSITCLDFFTDFSPPVVLEIAPEPGSIIENTTPTIEFSLYDRMSGVDTSSLEFTIDGITYYPTIEYIDSTWYAYWEPGTPFPSGDSINICVTVTDTTDYCDDNILDSCWYFMINIDTLQIALPDTQAYLGDTILITVSTDDATIFNITSFSLVIQFDPSVLTAIGIETDGTLTESWAGSITHDITDGLINISGNGSPLEDGAVLLYLEFLVEPDGVEGSFSRLEFDEYTFNEGRTAVNATDGFLIVEWTTPEWMADLIFTSPTSLLPVTLTFGVSASGEDGYDPGLDLISLPSSSKLIAFFPLADSEFPHINRLQRDIRNSEMLPVVWEAVVNVEPDSAEWTVEWYPEYLPDGKLEFYTESGPFIDMHINNNFSSRTDGSVFIRYSHPEIEIADIYIEPGWNLVSFPYIPTGYITFVDLLPSVISNGYWYDPGSGAYVEMLYPEAGKGYWLFAEDVVDVRIAGMPVFEYSIQVYEGWNLIGVPFSPSETIPVTETYWWYNTDTGMYESSSDELIMGFGYWYFSDRDGTISADSTGIR